MPRTEIIINECICVRACMSGVQLTLCTFFFFRFITIKTWVVSLYYRGVICYNFPLQNIAFISLKTLILCCIVRNSLESSMF